MSERPSWRFQTLRGQREVVLRSDLTEADGYRILSHLSVLHEAKGWALDPLTRDVFREMHGALAGHDPREHCAEGLDVMIERVERALELRDLVVLRIPALVIGGGVPGEDPEEPAEPGEPPEEPQKDDPRIVSVQWVEGGATIAGGTQWVNLPRDAKWVDGTRVTTIDRCSNKPWIKVAFDRPGAHHFKIKLVPDASNLVYSGTEKGRNANYTFEESERDYNTNGDGTRVILGDMFITVAGKASWTLKAKDDYGHEVQSGALSTKRLVYYVELPMQGLTSVATSLSTMTSEFANQGLELVSLGRQNMTNMPNVSTTDSATFQNNARTAYQAAGVSAKEPYVIAIAYTGHLAVMDANQVARRASVTVGPTAAPVTIRFLDASSSPVSLWKNIVPGQDWFVSASYQPDGGGAAVNIPAAKVTAVPDDAAVPDDCTRASVDVTGLPAGTGTITLTVNWVNRFRAGLSFPGGNLVCICTRAFWRNETNDSQNQVMVHEIGHHIGMVPDGNGTNTDQTATQYINSGHRGSHCHNGVPTAANYGGAAGSTCVMFGETNGLSAFCANCTPGACKNDLTTGWTAF
mgnify:CR=1 FL=1